MEATPNPPTASRRQALTLAAALAATVVAGAAAVTGLHRSPTPAVSPAAVVQTAPVPAAPASQPAWVGDD